MYGAGPLTMEMVQTQGTPTVPLPSTLLSMRACRSGWGIGTMETASEQLLSSSLISIETLSGSILQIPPARGFLIWPDALATAGTLTSKLRPFGIDTPPCALQTSVVLIS